MDRRQLLGGVITGGLAAMTLRQQAMAADGATGTGWFGERRLPIGLQTYTLGDALRTDLDGTLARLAAIGFRTLELPGYYGHPVQTLRDAAVKHGLKYTSIHVNMAARGGDPGLDQDIARLAADLHVLGVTDVVVPMYPVPERFGAARAGEGFAAFMERVAGGMTHEEWRGLARQLNAAGLKLRREGLRLGYHNHNPELAPVGDTTGLEILIAETSPEDVSFELDVAWVAAAGRDPVQLLLTWGRRFQLMHVKDMHATTKPNYALRMDPAEVGSGSLEWRRILPAAFAVGVRKYYVEQEPPFTIERMAAAEKSFRFLTAFDMK